jgi:tetratricopeptide (TPR) repeat protein
LRQASGLTQAQLADGDFTKGFISQLEGGHSKISVHAAQVLAGRLGIGVSDLLDDESGGRVQRITVVRAEAELARGDPALALKLSRELTATGPHRAHALRLQGRALLALDRSREAIPILNDALLQLRATGAADTATRTLYDLAFAHARLDETEEAILTALECERALKAGELIDRTLELELRTLLASLHVRRGDFAAGDLQIERALQLAEDVSSREARAGLYASLAKSEQERGDPTRATELWERSLRELESLGLERAVAETWNNLALAQRERGAAREARRSLAKASELAEQTQHARLQTSIAVTRAKLALDANQLTEAEQIAVTVAKDPGAPPRIRAEAQLVMAAALTALGAPLKRVKASFEEALKLAEQQPPGVRFRILRQYADALEAAGELAESNRLMREALELIRPGTARR